MSLHEEGLAIHQPQEEQGVKLRYHGFRGWSQFVFDEHVSQSHNTSVC